MYLREAKEFMKDYPDIEENSKVVLKKKLFFLKRNLG